MIGINNGVTDIEVHKEVFKALPSNEIIVSGILQNNRYGGLAV